MTKYVAKRILMIVPSILFLGFIIYWAARYMPAMQPVINRIGLQEKNIILEYFDYLSKCIQGDFGMAYKTGKPAASEIIRTYPVTLKLALAGAAFSTAAGLILGIAAALNRNKFIDNLILVLSMVTASFPLFFTALILMLIFSLKLGWLPSIASTSWKGYIMPVITLGLPAIGYMARVTRQSMLESLNQDYIRTSKARGIPHRVIVFSHALKNAIVPIITAMGVRFGELLVGTVLVENAFSIPGLGRLMITSINDREYYVIIASVLALAATFLVINIFMDILYAFADPKIKFD